MPKIHLDTDIGGDMDDLCALAMLLKWPDLEITGVTPVSEEQGRGAGYAHYVLDLVGPMSLEGIPQGRYRTMNEKEVEALRLAMKTKPKLEIGAARTVHAAGRAIAEKRKELRPERTHKTLWKKAGEKRQPWKRGGSHKPRPGEKPEWRRPEGNAGGEKPWKKKSRSAGKPEWKKRDEKKPEEKRGLREKWRRAGAKKREK